MKKTDIGVETTNATSIDSILEDIPTSVNCKELPVKHDAFWANFKAFWLQEVEQDNFWFKDIVIEPAKPKANGKPRSFLFKRITLA